MNFLFWNIRGNSKSCNKPLLLATLSRIINEESVDVLALTEYEGFGDSLTDELRTTNVSARLENPTGVQDSVIMYYNPERIHMSIAQNNTYTTPITITNIASEAQINAFFCHLPSKLLKTPSDQRDYASDFIEEVLDFEKHVGSNNTLICGDFNMCPFEEGMINSKGFHSIMDASITNRNPQRSVNKKLYSTFYNPMWGLIGDLGKGEVSGTYYSNKNRTNEYFWYMLDQVIVRPSLLNSFDSSKLRVISKGCTYDLLTNQSGINKKISDHLPIFFTLIF